MIQKVRHKELLNTEVRMLQMLGKELYSYGLLLTGGSIWCAYRGIPINDIDIVSMSGEILAPKTQMDILGKCIRSINQDALVYSSNVFSSKFAMNFTIKIDNKTYKVQFINPLDVGAKNRTPLEIVQEYDISNCMLYIDHNGRIQSNVNSGFTHNVITSRNLALGKVGNVANTLSRLNKYKDRGATYNNEVIQQLGVIKEALCLWNIIFGRTQEDVCKDDAGYETLSMDSKKFTYTEAYSFVQQARSVLQKVLTDNLSQQDRLLLLNPPVNIFASGNIGIGTLATATTRDLFLI